MKKSPRKLQLSRETLTTLTLETNKLAAAGEDSSIIALPPLPPTSDTVRICCA